MVIHFKTILKGYFEVGEKVWLGFNCGCRREHEIVSFGEC